MKVLEYDSFTTQKGKGNPAGVVYLDSQVIEDRTMQDIAASVGFNETVFIFGKGDRFRFRYFTPGHEINLCGHATVAATGYLYDHGLLSGKQLSIETNIGHIMVDISLDEQSLPLVTMQQGEPSFADFSGSPEGLCHALGITTGDLDDSLPLVYGSTGTWTLLVPIREISTFGKMRPKNELFPHLLTSMPKASVHPYCLEQFKNRNMVYARHFSSPFSRTIEDPVTGTASGVIGEFLLAHYNLQSLEFAVHQGQEVGRPGKVLVRAQRGQRVTISGQYVRGEYVQAAEGLAAHGDRRQDHTQGDQDGQKNTCKHS